MSAFTDETWYRREIVTPALKWLGDELCRRTGRPADAAGDKGNEAHNSGSHRSQEWLKNSRFCDNRTYTVQSGLTGDQARHIAGFDFTPGSDTAMIAQCKRLYAALRAGQVEEVREFYGNVDGDKVVDGWNNLENRNASSDSSHLWHWHLSFDRRRMTDQALMERVVGIVMGDDMAESYSPFTKPTAAGDRPTILFAAEMWRLLRDGAQGVYDTTLPARGGLLKRLDRIEDALTRLEAKPAGDVDEAALAVALAPLIDAGATPEEVAAAVVAKFAGKLASTGG